MIATYTMNSKENNCELFLRIAHLKLEAIGDEVKTKHIESLEVLARFDPDEAKQILGIKQNKKSKISTAEKVIIGLITCILVLLWSYENKVSHLNFEVERLTTMVEDLGGEL